MLTLESDDSGSEGPLILDSGGQFDIEGPDIDSSLDNERSLELEGPLDIV